MIASLVFVVLKLVSKITNSIFSESWHYYSYLLLFALFGIPFYKWLPSDISSTSSVSIRIPVENYAKSMILLDVAVYVLLSGTIIYLARYIYYHQKMHRTLRKTCMISNEEHYLQALTWSKRQLNIKRNFSVYISPYMTTPFIYGLWKPRIVLPSISFTNEELRHIFLHELTHYKRGDMWTHLFMIFIFSLHWFNPLIHLIKSDIERYGESACDEKITNQMGASERKRYCELILKVLWNVVGQKDDYSLAMSRERKNIEKRMDTILQRKTSKRMNMLLGMVVTFIFAVLGTMAGFTTQASTTSLPDNQNINIGEEEPAGEEEKSNDIYPRDAFERPLSSNG